MWLNQEDARFGLGSVKLNFKGVQLALKGVQFDQYSVVFFGLKRVQLDMKTVCYNVNYWRYSS